MFKKDESEEQESSSSATANVQSKSQPIDYDLLSESIVGASAANYGNVEVSQIDASETGRKRKRSGGGGGALPCLRPSSPSHVEYLPMISPR